MALQDSAELHGCYVFLGEIVPPAPAHPDGWSTGKESYGLGTRAVNSLPLFNLPLFQPWVIFQSHSIWLAPLFLKRTGKEDSNMPGRYKNAQNVQRDRDKCDPAEMGEQ
jgi:hypothetical protein